MKIKSENAILNPETFTKGDKLFEFTINLKEIRLNEGENMPEKLLNASRKSSNEFLAKIYSSVAEHLKDINVDDSAKKHLACLEHSDGCTYVWYACGSCQGNYALVEAFCPDGDYRWCEKC